ncbi:hypothetical protein GCM10023311_15090 [Flaviramulus aquimarinus]|uniref:Secretion system C-terminal sorting domain-containing protein n=1 Tax=Flaviramulus aquimarinus TaxID=1170456 RepID=A0ABP9F377_9FLAO
MTKKITFLFFLLTAALGYSQACTGTSSDTVQGSFNYNYSFETIGGTNVKIIFEILDTFPGLVGQLQQPGGVFTNMTDTGGQTYEVTLAGQVDGTPLTFNFFGPFAGGQIAQTIEYNYTVGDTCTATPSEEDVTLSDLQVDGATITGFSPALTSYSISVGLGDPIPQITSVTTTEALATVGTITQASAVPGSASFDVTSEDTTITTTYTVNFILIGPAIAAPTPPNRAPADVISIYSDAYTDTTIDNFDFGLCSASPSVAEEIIAGNPTQHFLGQGCQGIDFQNNRIDASAFTHVHFDFYTDETNIIGKVFNIKLVDWAGNPTEAGSTGLEVIFNDGTSPALVAGTWVSIDVDISSLGGLVLGNLTRNDVAQLHITSNLSNAWYDNLYLHKNTTLGLQDVAALKVKVFPNPTQASWNIRTENVNMSSIKVFDVLGKNVLSLTPNKTDTVIDGSSLRSGLYFAQIKTDTGISSIKLIKN